MNNENQVPNSSKDSFKEIQFQIDAARTMKDMNQMQRYRLISDIIWDDMCQRGKFYKDGNNLVYYFNRVQKKLIPLDIEQLDFRLYVFEYGVNSAENMYKYLHDHIYMMAVKNAELVSIHKFCYYNPDTFTLYISMNNNQVLKIPPTEKKDIIVVENGTDNVLFLTSPDIEPFEYIESPEPEQNFETIVWEKINFEDGYFTIGEQKLFFIYWFYSLFFESILQTKPIIALEGDWGSGKTTAMRSVLRVLYGPKADVTMFPSDIKDFDNAITNNEIVIFDNIDEVPKWLNEKLSICGTGGTLTKRVLFTTNTLVTYKIRCFLGLTSFVPYKFKKDVASRMLPLKLKAIDQCFDEIEHFASIKKNRDSILSNMAFILQDLIFHLKKYKEISIKSKIRMSGFAKLILKGVYDDVEHKNYVETLFNKLADKQRSSTQAKDQITEALIIWAKSNPGRFVLSSELYEELLEIGRDHRLNITIANGRSLAQWLSNMKISLSSILEISEKVLGGRVKYYSFTYLEETKDEKIDQYYEIDEALAYDDPATLNASIYDGIDIDALYEPPSIEAQVAEERYWLIDSYGADYREHIDKEDFKKSFGDDYEKYLDKYDELAKSNPDDIDKDADKPSWGPLKTL